MLGKVFGLVQTKESGIRPFNRNRFTSLHRASCFPQVAGEVDKRLNRLDVLKGDLENFNGDLDAFDVWMDEASREMYEMCQSVPQAHDTAESDHLIGLFKVSVYLP